MYQQHGASLVNLLVSLALASGLLLMLGQTLHYSLVKQKHLQAHIFLQEDANLLLQLLSEEVRLAGFSAYSNAAYQGSDSCGASRLWIFDMHNSLDTQKNQQESILQIPLTEACLRISPRADSDILFVRRLAATPLAADGGFEKAWYLLQSQHRDDQILYLEAWPSSLLQSGDLLWKVDSKIFYVRNYSVQGDNTPSLVMAKPVANGFEHQVVAENVESMQLQWLIRSDESLTVVHKPTAEELSKASLLRIYLLMRSDAIEANEADFILAKPYTAEDRGLYYQDFSASVFLRGRER